MSGFSVTLNDSEMWEFAQNYPRALKNAVRSSVRTTTTFAKKETDKQLTDVYFTPPKTLKKFRDKSKYYELRDGVTFRGRIWAGSNKMIAAKSVDNSFLGSLRQDEGGAWAGKYYFKGAFIAKMESGHTSIFSRLSSKGGWKGRREKRISPTTGKSYKSELPIFHESIRLSKTDENMSKITVEVGIELANRFDAKIRHYLQTGYIPSGDD